jgi:hypothetical protein
MAAACLSLVGCSQAARSSGALDSNRSPQAITSPIAQSPNADNPPQETTVAQAQPPIALKSPALQKEMSYETARQLIINAGWQPLGTTTDNPQEGTKSWRDRGYSEVSSCSGTGMGFCRFEFTGSNHEKL